MDRELILHEEQMAGPRNRHLNDFMTAFWTCISIALARIRASISVGGEFVLA